MSELADLLRRLKHEALARGVLVVSDEGVLLGWDTDPGLSTDTLGGAALRSMGGIEGLARQLQTSEFGVLLHHSPTEEVYVSVLDGECLLVVVFDQGRTSLGSVRLCVKAFQADVSRAVLAELAN